MGAQSEGKTDDCQKPDSAAAIVPHNAMADSLMEEISLFVEENCDNDGGTGE